MNDARIRKITAELLIMAMRTTDDMSERVLMLQRYVQKYGPVPRGYRAKVDACLKRKVGEDDEQVPCEEDN